MTAENLVRIQHLKKWFPIYGDIISKVTGHVKAVDDISFDIARQETFGLVGESGCGKSTTARLIMRLVEPTSGSVFFGGKNIMEYHHGQLNKLRRNVQIIFQDPYASLNPRMTVGEIIGKPLQVHDILKGPALVQRVAELMDIVGLRPKFASRYPHEFSGGQRQRIGIARALALNDHHE